MSQILVTTKHVFTVPMYRDRAGLCRAGVRAWVESHGWDYRKLVKTGLPVEELEAVDDAMAQAVAKWARECHAREGRGE